MHAFPWLAFSYYLLPFLLLFWLPFLAAFSSLPLAACLPVLGLACQRLACRVIAACLT
jgi:hypothetical protein